MQRILKMIALVTVISAISACTNFKEIPAGYIGRVLTPTGWQNKMLEAGQVDLGEKNANGSFNTLVLLEATSTTVKEQFMAASAEGNVDKQDHRILTKNGTPLAVDVYIRAMIPDGETERNNIFVLVTPRSSQNDSLVKWIMVQDVYARFAMMDVRSKVRVIFASYKDYQDVYAHYEEIDTKISTMVSQTFEKNGVPLKLQNASLSNVKPDESVWAAQNQNAGAQAKVDTINAIGAALRNNPEYESFMKWESLMRIAEVGSKSGTNTVIITDGNTGNQADSFAAAEYLRGRLTPPKQ